MKTGRPEKVTITAEAIERLAAAGYSHLELGRYFGVHHTTLYARREKDSAFAGAWKRGEEGWKVEADRRAQITTELAELLQELPRQLREVRKELLAA